MRAHRALPQSRKGFSLIELMVAMVIGLVATLAVMQVFSSTEARRRTTGSVASIQSEGAISFFMLERDLRLGGYGFSSAKTLGCSVSAYDSARSTPAFSFNLLPVSISAGSNTDSITVLYGNSTLSVDDRVFTASTNTSKKLADRTGYMNGDLIIVAMDAATDQCGLFEITSNTNTDLLTIDHANATSYTHQNGSSVTSRFNPADGHGISFAIATSSVFDLGPAPALNRYSVSNGKLQVEDLLRNTDPVTLADNVVALKAQYWEDVDNDYTEDAGEWKSTTPSNWARVRAIRMAALMRSPEYEVNKDVPAANKGRVTTTAPSWAGGSFSMLNLDGSTSNTDYSDQNWRYYRYRVFETVVPLRNMLWNPPNE